MTEHHGWKHGESRNIRNFMVFYLEGFDNEVWLWYRREPNGTMEFANVGLEPPGE